MGLERPTGARNLVRRHRGKLLAAFASGFLVFAVVVAVSNRFRAFHDDVRSIPVQLARTEPAPTIPVSETLTTATKNPEVLRSGTDAVMGPGIQGRRQREKRAKTRAKKIEPATTPAATPPPTVATTLSPSMSQTKTPPRTDTNQNAEPTALVIPVDSTIAVRLTEPISTKEVHKGAIFHGVLASALEADGQTVAPAGASVRGRIIESKRAGFLGRHSVLSLELTQLADEEGAPIPIRTTQWYANGKRGLLTAFSFLGKDEEAAGAAESQADMKGGDISLPRGARIGFRLVNPLRVR